MQKILAITILSLSIISCGGNKGEESDETVEAVDSNYCNCAELIYDEGYNHFYRYKRREGFTGICETFHPNGNIWEHKPMTNGKIHGKMIVYYESGQVYEEKEFDMNFQVGEQITYAENGEVRFHALYNRGRQTEILVNRKDI